MQGGASHSLASHSATTRDERAGPKSGIVSTRLPQGKRGACRMRLPAALIHS